jgi:hypothetical protein
MNERVVDELTRRVPLKEPPLCFNLDFHAIPFRGPKADLENHGQPAVMAFVAQEAERRVLCYATAHGVRAEADTLVVKFADHGHTLTGPYPSRLLFDSRATT